MVADDGFIAVARGCGLHRQSTLDRGTDAKAACDAAAPAVDPDGSFGAVVQEPQRMAQTPVDRGNQKQNYEADSSGNRPRETSDLAIRERSLVKPIGCRFSGHRGIG